MLNRLNLLTAACLMATAGVVGLKTSYGDDPITSAVNTAMDKDVSLPAGIAAKDLNSDKAIEKAFKGVTEYAIDKTGFDNLVGYLVDQDRDRIKKSLPSGRSLSDVKGDKNKQLADLVADIDGSFKSKYNQKFDMDYSKVFTKDRIHILTGEVSDPQLLVGKWPVDPMVSLSGTGTSGKVSQSDADIAKSKTFGGDVNLEKGRNVAIAHLLSTRDMSGINASMIHEAGGWKFDVPNTLDAGHLYDNLINSLTYLDTHKDAWPSDVNDAYRGFAHAVTAALYDQPITREGGTARMLDSGSPRPAGNTAENR